MATREPTVEAGATSAAIQSTGATSEFHTSANSPFPDKYDLDAEQQAIAHLLAADDPDPSDPLYPRFELYLERLKDRDQMLEEHRARQSANHEVPIQQASRLKQIGALYAEDEDTMLIHTLEACRIYMGVSPEPGSGKKYGVPGARRAATALRQLFLLTGHDNPYADLILIDCDKRIAEARKLISDLERAHLNKLEERRLRGLNYSVLQSKSPQQFSLGYHSPYGYAVTDLCVSFDYAVRVVKSAARRDLVSKQQERLALQRMKKEIRGLFEAVIQSSRGLLDKQLLGLCRSDWLPQSEVPAKKRVEAAREIMGAVPQDVFTHQQQPRHSLRNQRVSAREIELLRQLIVDDKQEAEAEKTAQKLINTDGLVE